MDITIGSFKIKLEIVLLFIVLLWLMFGHAIGSCCNMGLKDTVELFTGGSDTAIPALTDEEKQKIIHQMAIAAMADPNTSEEDKIKIKKLLDSFNKLSETVGTGMGTGTDMGTGAGTGTVTEPGTGVVISETTTTTGTEPFVGSNNSAEGPEFALNKSPGYIRNPSTWTSVVNYDYNQNNNITPGELDIFAKMNFKPECCPNTYSSSMGCACMSTDTYDMLRTRAGNNEPYSEY